MVCPHVGQIAQDLGFLAQQAFLEDRSTIGTLGRVREELLERSNDNRGATSPGGCHTVVSVAWGQQCAA